jgi:signal transduction histidine kinase
VQLPRLFSTTSFRLATLFALIFGLSAGAVGAFVFVTVNSTLNNQERTRVQADALALKGEYDSGGMRDLMDAIHDRQHDKIAGGLDYTLFRANGDRLFGKLPKQQLKPGWKHLFGPPDGDEPKGELERLLVFRQQLTPDLWLVVGDDVGRLHELGNDFLRVFGLAMLLALTLAVTGGAAVSIAFLRRIDSITRTAEAIIEGDVGQRISLRGSGDDLDRLAGTLNRMLDRIGVLMDAVRHVSTDIAHDLRTPLSRLRNALENARDRARDVTEYKSAVSQAILESDAILETFSAILRIAQIESGSRRAGFRRINLSELVSNVAQSFLPTAEEQGHALVSHIENGIEIEGDRELVTQLAANLLDNAIRHTPNGVTIGISLKQNEAAAVLEVFDNGNGVASNERGKIFDRFYRGEASRTTPGNGLGLSLVAAVAGLHRGTATALDNNCGLVVRVEFPFGEKYVQ